MEVVVTLLTWLSEVVRWILGKVWTLLSRWIRKRMYDAVIPSDFSVDVITGVDPLRLRLDFKVHNGTASGIRLNAITVHLFCGGAHVRSMVGAVSDNPLIHVAPPHTTVARGKSASITIDITPDLYLWFWLLPGDNYSLRSSSIEVQTSWGAIDIPLTGNVTSKVGKYRGQIDEFLDRVQRVFGVRRNKGERRSMDLFTGHAIKCL